MRTPAIRLPATHPATAAIRLAAESEKGLGIRVQGDAFSRFGLLTPDGLGFGVSILRFRPGSGKLRFRVWGFGFEV